MNDIPIIGQSSRQGNRLLSTALFAAEAVKVLDHGIAWENRRKIHELRKSCGVEDKPGTISVRCPPRYRGTP